MAIRSGIFLVGGLVSIIFRKQLDNIKNSLFTRLNIYKVGKDEKKAYVNIGILLMIISIVLFVIAVAS